MNSDAPNDGSTLWDELRSTVAGRISRQWAILTTGNLARLPVALLTSVIVARGLGVEDYGSYQVLVTVVTFAGIAADPGLGEAAVWRFARLRRANPQYDGVEVGAYFWGRLLTGLVVGALVVGGSGPLARAVFGSNAPSSLVALVSVVVLVTAVTGALRSLLQAERRFGTLAAALFVTSTTTLLAAGLLVVLNRFSVATVLVLLPVGGGLGGGYVAWRGLPDRWSLEIPTPRTLVRCGWRLVRFGRWLWLGHIATILAARLDIILVNRALSAEWTGAYGLALALSGRVGMLYRTVFTVLRPVASALEGRDEAKSYLRRALIRSTGVSLLMLPGFLLADPLIPWLFGAQYENAVVLFQGLLVVGMLEAVFIPLKTLFYTFDRPGYLSGVEGLEALVLIGGSFVTLPSYGVWGVIASKAAARVVGAASAAAVLRRIWSVRFL